MIYLLDSNVYINAKNHFYRMKVFPGFWEWLDHSCSNGKLCSIKMVQDELKNYGDELSKWVQQRPEHFIEADDIKTQNTFSEIAQFVMGHSIYAEPHRGEFLRVADPLLIAKAKTMEATVVTHETLVSPNSKKVKIPNICKEFHVNYCNTYELLEALGARFILTLPA